MFLSKVLSGIDEDDFEELDVVMNRRRNTGGLAADNVLEILQFLDPNDYAICLNVMMVSKFVRKFFERNHYYIGNFVFKVTKPEFLRKHKKIPFVYQLEVNNERKEIPFDDSMLRCFQNLQKIVLTMPGKSVQNSGFKHVPELRYLEIDNSHNFGTSNITSEVFKILPNLEKLFLSYLPKNFNFLPMKSLEKLEVLYVSGEFVNFQIFDHFPTSMSLKKLRFIGCRFIQNVHFEKVPKNVDMVAVRRCRNVDRGVIELLKTKVNPDMKVFFEREEFDHDIRLMRPYGERKAGCCTLQ